MKCWIDNTPGLGPHMNDLDPSNIQIVRVMEEYPPFAFGRVVAFFVGENAERNAAAFISATWRKGLSITGVNTHKEGE